jgi:hypothetical protein
MRSSASTGRGEPIDSDEDALAIASMAPRTRRYSPSRSSSTGLWWSSRGLGRRASRGRRQDSARRRAGRVRQAARGRARGRCGGARTRSEASGRLAPVSVQHSRQLVLVELNPLAGASKSVSQVSSARSGTAQVIVRRAQAAKSSPRFRRRGRPADQGLATPLRVRS